MDALVTREKLHALVDKIPQERIQEVYEILEDAGGHYSDEFKATLDAEYADYQLNGGVVTQEQVDEEINMLLYGKRK